jgi:hypothetical protein
MHGIPIGGHVAVAQEGQRQEEEMMTTYKQEDLSGEWEFKILRSVTNQFKKPHVLQQVLQEERLGNWELVEKFDDGRLRFKRPTAARSKDQARPRGYDPYRTRHGMGEGAMAIWITTAVFGGVGVIFGIAWLINGGF